MIFFPYYYEKFGHMVNSYRSLVNIDIFLNYRDKKEIDTITIGRKYLTSPFNKPFGCYIIGHQDIFFVVLQILNFTGQILDTLIFIVIMIAFNMRFLKYKVIRGLGHCHMRSPSGRIHIFTSIIN